MATVFSIQRFSIHDGPGIRTTVFFSGCPLRCLWCHNPESHETKPPMAHFANRCIRCDACIAACPQSALSRVGEHIVADADRCVACNECLRVCPTEARRRYGEDYSVDQLTKILLRDHAYYKNSNGGVTFSGGEPLLHTAFIVPLAESLKANGVHIAIESCLYADYERQIEPLLPLVNLWMVDVKAMDDERHRAATGKPVTPILNNIRRLSQDGANVIIRVPVVVGLNDDKETMNRMAGFLSRETRILRVDLLKMHKLAQHKYEALGRVYPAQDFPIPSDDQLYSLARLLAASKLDVMIGESIPPQNDEEE